jgi:hypothetical protein
MHAYLDLFMSSPQDFFRVLELAWDSEQELRQVDEHKVKRQYRKLALKLHPDKNKSDPNAEVKFNQLKNACDAMLDEKNRNEIVNALRALLQRKQDRAGRDAEKQRLVDELEKKEAKWLKESIAKDDIKTIRARHRMMVEQLQVKRKLAHANGAAARGNSTALGGPDDTNMDLEYWITYGLNETDDVRKSKRNSELVKNRESNKPFAVTDSDNRKARMERNTGTRSVLSND